MKRKYILRSLRDYILDNKLYYMIVGIAVVLGIIVGSISAVSMNAENYESLNEYVNNFISAYNLQPVNRANIFETSFLGNLKLILFLCFSGFWVGFIPFTVLQMSIKSYKLGFSIAFFVMAYRGQGIIFSLMSLMPQILILMPALVIYAVFNIKYAISIQKLRMRRISSVIRREMYFRSFLCLIAMLGVATVCSFFDAFVISAVLKPICILFNR